MGKKTKLGAVAGLAAAAAGAYFLYYSKHAKKNRAKVADWMESAQKEVVKEVRRLKDATLNEKNYQRIVDAVTEKYRKVRAIESSELERFRTALGSAWKQFQEEFAKSDNKSKKT